MILLGRVVEEIRGVPLAEYLRGAVFEPLGMKDTSYRPPFGRCAPTRPKETGVVHDPLARAYGCPERQPGNAGLFSTGDDLARFCAALLRGEVLRPETLRRAFAPNADLRGLGWRMWRDAPFAPGVGHTGFTGTLVWLDPAKGRFALVLTNGVYPGERANVERLRREVLAAVNR